MARLRQMLIDRVISQLAQNGHEVHERQRHVVRLDLERGVESGVVARAEQRRMMGQVVA